MFHRARSVFVVLGAALLCAGWMSATTLTTQCVTTATGCWQNSSYITGSPTELNFNTISNVDYPSGTTLSSTANSSIVFPITGPSSGPGELAGNTSSTKELVGGYIDIAMPTGGENAILLSLAGTGTITVTLSDGSVLSGSQGFFGFSVSHDVTWADITTTGSSVALNDFYYATSALTQDAGGGNPQPVPEATTLTLTCAGFLIALGGGRKLFLRRFV